MENRITQEEIRLVNRQQIYHYIYENARASSQEICSALFLSRPTVASNLSALEAEGLIRRDGLQEAGQVGRRAVVYSIVPDYRIAIGVEVLAGKTNILAIDLNGHQIDVSVLRFPYENVTAFYEKLCSHITGFIRAMKFSREQVLGICITLQGLASPDCHTLVYGEILGNTGLRIEVFERFLDYPCCFIHDPAAAAQAELQIRPDLDSMFYLSLSSHLGGAIVLNRHVQTGKHGHPATFEHIQAVQDGEVCYCGQRGCWDTLCSMPAIMGDEEPEDFFRIMRTGDPERSRSWHTFLLHLARLIRDLHLVNDIDIMLGGILAAYMTSGDIRILYDEISKLCPFKEEDDFILLSRMTAYHIPTGAALRYIHMFLDDAI